MRADQLLLRDLLLDRLNIRKGSGNGSGHGGGGAGMRHQAASGAHQIIDEITNSLTINWFLSLFHNALPFQVSAVHCFPPPFFLLLPRVRALDREQDVWRRRRRRSLSLISRAGLCVQLLISLPNNLLSIVCDCSSSESMMTGRLEQSRNFAPDRGERLE